jgi:hypothetical protein
VGEEGRKKKEIGGKKGEVGRIKWDPRGAGERPAVARWLRAYSIAASLFPIFLIWFDFWFDLIFIFWEYEVLPGILGEWVYNTPIFWSLPNLTLEVLNLPFLMEIGDFIFFQILYFLNLEYI